MNCFKKIVFLSFAAFFLLGACINLEQPNLKVHYYTLEYETQPIADIKPLPAIIRLDRFSVAPVFNTNRIIYREQSFKREAYVYHKWQANPGELVSYLLARDMQQSGLFEGVFSSSSSLTPSHILSGSIDEFLEWDTEGAWQAVLALSVTLVTQHQSDARDGVLFQRAYRCEETCDQKNPRALAEAMSRAMAKISTEIIEDIHSSLAQ